MSDVEREEITASVKRIELALIGDKQLGHRGLVAEVYDHGKRIGRLERWVVYGTGAGAALVLVYTIIMEYLRATGGNL